MEALVDGESAPRPSSPPKGPKNLQRASGNFCRTSLLQVASHYVSKPSVLRTPSQDAASRPPTSIGTDIRLLSSFVTLKSC